MGWLGRAGCAGRAARHSDAGEVETEHERLAIHASERQIGIVRQPQGGVAIQSRIRHPFEDALDQPVSQRRAMCVSGIHFLGGEKQGDCHANDTGRIFGSGPAGSLLCAAVLLPGDRCSSAAIE